MTLTACIRWALGQRWGELRTFNVKLKLLPPSYSWYSVTYNGGVGLRMSSIHLMGCRISSALQDLKYDIYSIKVGNVRLLSSLAYIIIYSKTSNIDSIYGGSLTSQ